MGKVKLNKTGDSKAFQCTEFPCLTCTIWKNKKEILMLLNNTKPYETTVKDKIEGVINTSSYPVYLQNIMNKKGGVDSAVINVMTLQGKPDNGGFIIMVFYQ